MSEIKSSAITYAGYQYQTMYGVKLLIDWLNAPDHYQYIQFEADSVSGEIPQGIDDIVCQRTDGKTDFWQVKFSPSPEKDTNQLTWKWLLHKSGKTERSRSILQKLADAVDIVSSEQRGRVVLLTNKFPDRSAEESLSGNHFVFTQVPETDRAIIIEQLGEQGRAERLFSILEIQHSDQRYKTLQRTIHENLRERTNEEGLYRLLDRAKDWAIHPDLPSEGGKIFLDDIRAVISPLRPRPIPQNFLVPENYIVPDETFHDDFKANLLSGQNIIVLTGSPGKGKSTYLSYLCQQLEAEGQPYIRHHYHLSLQDRTNDRISAGVVAEGLLQQIESRCPESAPDIQKPEDLHKVIELCGKIYKKMGKRFIVLLDGLDHVWRDNDENKTPLDKLFRQLIPVPDNVTLVIGSQPVDERMLPERLIVQCPKTEWHYIPAMSGNAIHTYLHHQVQAGRLKFPYQESQYEDELATCAEKMVGITHGYPLHVIYSCEYLHSSGEGLSSYHIEKLPPCESGDIREYYQRLWQRLTHAQRDVLHLCCAFSFLWPGRGFSTVLREQPVDKPSLQAVVHLLYESLSGFRPFHESLTVFVRGIQEHQDRIKILLPSLIDWLENTAPEETKVCWLWYCQAMAGDSVPLRQGVKRDWVIDRLSEGHGVEEFVRLLSLAEMLAFDEQSYAEAYCHRTLKRRMQNGADFEIEELSALLICCLVNAPGSLVNQFLSMLDTRSPKELSTLAIALWFRGDSDNAGRLSSLALQCYFSEIDTYTSRQAHESRTDINLLINAAVIGDIFNEQWLEGSNFNEWETPLKTTFTLAAEQKGDISLLFSLYERVTSPEEQSILELSIVRLGIIEGIELTAWSSFMRDENRALPRLYTQLTVPNRCPVNLSANFSRLSGYRITEDLSYEGWFFECLIVRLLADCDFSWLPANAENVSAHYRTLQVFANQIAQKMSKGEPVHFGHLCKLLDSLDTSQLNLKDWNINNQLKDFYKAWLHIAATLHLLINTRPISCLELEQGLAVDSVELGWMRKLVSDCPTRMLEGDAVSYLIEQDKAEQDKLVEATSERTVRNLEISLIALKYELLNETKVFSRLTWDCVLGYGYHKDMALNHTIEAASHIAEVDPVYAKSLLERLSPLVNNICDFTDGDHTRYAVSDLTRLCAKIGRSTLASIYDDFVNQGKWSDADQALLYYLRQSELTSLTVQALFRSIHNNDQLAVLQQFGNEGHSDAITLLSNMGLSDNALPASEMDTSETADSRFDPISIPIEQFEQLLDKKDSKQCKIWYEYWLSQGKERDLVATLLPYLDEGKLSEYECRPLLPLLFESIRKIRGKNRAFSVLVHEHNINNGWGQWSESENSSYVRLDTVLKRYPERISEFIVSTTKASNTWSSDGETLIMPDTKLVYLLTKAGEVDAARSFCDAMAKMLEDDTRNFPLQFPKWEWQEDIDDEQISIRILIRRLFWPVLAVKHDTAVQLSCLLSNGYRSDCIEDFLVAELSTRRLEVEVVDILTVFWLAKQKGYSISSNIPQAIHARSSLSDYLLERICPGTTLWGQYRPIRTPLCAVSEDVATTNDQDYELAPIYMNRLSVLEEKIQVPVNVLFHSEWEQLCLEQEQRWQRMNYFFGTDTRTNTGFFASRNTQFGISAYLRTLTHLENQFGIPFQHLKGYIGLALAIEPVYQSAPSNTPKWLVEWEEGYQVTGKSLETYVKNCIEAYEQSHAGLSLGALSIPIQVDECTWLDVTMIRGKRISEGPIVFKLKSHDGGTSLGTLTESVSINESSFSEHSDYENCHPLFGRVYSGFRLGRWNLDFNRRGQFVPIVRDRVQTEADQQSVIFSYSGKNIGYSKHWRAFRQSTYPRELHSQVGTNTGFDRDQVPLWLDQTIAALPDIVLCEAQVLKREHAYEEFDQSCIRIAFDIS